jgi:hypothetical protein
MSLVGSGYRAIGQITDALRETVTVQSLRPDRRRRRGVSAGGS